MAIDEKLKKVIENLTDEELEQAIERNEEALLYMNEGWALTPVPVAGMDSQPSYDEIKKENEYGDALRAEKARRGERKSK